MHYTSPDRIDPPEPPRMTDDPNARRNPRWKFLAVAALALAWTVALLVPIPHQTAKAVLGSDDAKFWFAKCLHMSAYAFLAFSVGTFRLARRERILVLVSLFAHGAATEFFQQFVERGASLRDVMIDSAGIVLGVGAGWHWWRGILRPSPATGPET